MSGLRGDWVVSKRQDEVKAAPLNALGCCQDGNIEGEVFDLVYVTCRRYKKIHFIKYFRMLYDASMGEAFIRIELGFVNYFCPRRPWHIYRSLSSILHLDYQPQDEYRFGMEKVTLDVKDR